MAVAGFLRRSDTVCQHLLGFFRALGFRQRLRSHEVAGGVVGMGRQKLAKFLQRPFDFSGVGIFHGQAIAGECVRWILREDFGEQGDAVHKISF